MEPTEKKEKNWLSVVGRELAQLRHLLTQLRQQRASSKRPNRELAQLRNSSAELRHSPAARRDFVLLAQLSQIATQLRQLAYLRAKHVLFQIIL